MNVVLLIIMKVFFRLQKPLWRLFLGAMLGATGAVFIVLFPTMHIILKFIFLYLCAMAGMLIISFGYAGIKNLLFRIGSFYCIGFLVDGIFSFLYFRMNVSSYIKGIKENKCFANMTVWKLLLFSILLFLSVPILNGIYAKFSRSITTHYIVELVQKDKKKRGVGLLDTGNCLMDWATNNPVVIVEYSFIKDILEQEELQQIQWFLEQKDYKELFKREYNMHKLKLIPYHSLGAEHGMLVGIYIDNLRLFQNGRAKENKNTLVGLYQGNLSAAREYQIILHKDII